MMPHDKSRTRSHRRTNSGQPPQSITQLEELLSRPTPEVIQAVAGLEGDLLILGVGGKLGLSLARMAKRAFEAAGLKNRVLGVSRFSSRKIEARLESCGIHSLRCDLLDEKSVKRLPEMSNVLFLAGMKFGSASDPGLTWATNSYLPAIICQRFRDSRIVALSTGNVYGLSPAHGGGSCESDLPAPVGEYAMSCLGRERMFEYFSRQYRIPVALLRLNYACDLRYGVLVDLALCVYADQPIDLSMGYFNTIWQGDANAMILQSLAKATSPPLVLNVTGPELLSVREVCDRLGELLERKPRLIGQEAPAALLSNPQQACKLFGVPGVSAEQLLHWTAAWVQRDGATLQKPTHFQVRDGQF
jgi:nucleoside-diphosphate-sugar epimerase